MSVSGVLINDVDLASIGLRVSGVSGFAESPVKEYDEQNFGEIGAGAVVIEERYRSRSCSIVVTAKGTPSAIQAAVQTLSEIIQEEIPARITLDTSTDRQLFARLVSDPFSSIGAHFVSRGWRGELVFLASDPWFYNLVQSSDNAILSSPEEMSPLGDGPVRPDFQIVGPATDPVITVYNWAGVAQATLGFVGQTLAATPEYMNIRCTLGNQSIYRNTTGLFGSGTFAVGQRSEGTFLEIKREYSKPRTGDYAQLSVSDGELRAFWYNAWSRG